MARNNACCLLVGLLALFHTWGATADVEVNMMDRVEAFRGEAVSISCMFTSSEGVGGIMIQWFYVTLSGEKQKIYYQDATMKVVDKGTQFTDRISVSGTGGTGEVVLTISDVELRDEVEFICLIKGLTEGTGEGRTKLRVFVSPELPNIEGVQTGISVNQDGPSKIGTCEVKNGYPRPNITWYRNNTPLRGNHDVVKVLPSITTESSGLFSVKSELRMKVVKEDKDDLFYCEVKYFVPGAEIMTETNTINITVYYPSTAVSVWVESPKGNIKEGDSIELQCRGNGNMPSSILSITHKSVNLPLSNNVLLLDNVTRLHGGVYECTSTDTDTFEELSGNTSVSVHYLDPAVVMPEDAVVAQGEEITATCNALSSLKTRTSWMKNGKEVSKAHTLVLKDATFDSAGMYVCVVNVLDIEGMETSGTLNVKVEGAPKITTPLDTEIEESYKSTVHLSCSVRGFPTPTVTWTTSDGKILNSTSETENEGEVQSSVSVTVTGDMAASCNASNKFGADSATFNIKAKSKGVIIAVIIVCILLLAILGSVLYFLYKKGKICGRSGKQDLTKEKSGRDNIVVEMKSDNTEEAVLLGVNGEKQPLGNQ
ncbi:melanoma cell adhesion molecule b isoform X2 [Pseudoliparis swirei]|uniref:melanoma cell adhesion molecule b isoform X2 n=1 Tax=Pseudoliparis swirei TaxID=2059687 RepID=UPI0024BD7BFE|nr:melanoma cell adhesion molecule b isoform X2 [Pseudoliparis swirei]